MDCDKPRSTSSSELFTCFTSRLSSSSSSMKFSSKSILSPGRTRDPPISLSTSLSRRLRTNGSIKGGQASPMFPTGGKKRGCGFENQEPSSPKVTCIGQVRVKSKKKQGKRLRTLSRRHSTGEVSFRKLDQKNLNPNPNYQQGNVGSQECLPGQRNQRRVHLPLTICDALRTFGSEFSCLFPCRPSCFSTGEREREKREIVMEERECHDNGCGAVFARWLAALQDGDGGRGGGGGGGGGREIELVVGGEDDDDDDGERERPVRNSRRHVFDDLEIINGRIELKDEGLGKEEARVSICIPPKNALLLMRCRSDPMKMEALANRFWEPSVPKNEEDYEQSCDDEQEEEMHKDIEVVEEQKEEKFMDLVQVNEEQDNVEAVKEEENQEQSFESNEDEVEEETEVNQIVFEEENLFLGSLFQEIEENETSWVHTSMEDGVEQEEMVEEAALESTAEKGEAFEDVEEIVTQERSKQPEETQEEEEERESENESQAELERESVRQVEEEEERESVRQVEEEEERERERVTESRVLPDCLLLMMCEPKLSMEVSKETWVCSTDFIRRQSDKKKHTVKPIDGGDESSSNANKVSTESINYNNKPNPYPSHTANRPPIHHQPRRSSCSLPPRSSCSLPAASMATMIEQKLVNAVGYEPFVLTRCKSEPMMTAAKLTPETCFWKNRKLEPLRRATFGVGAAGVGC